MDIHQRHHLKERTTVAGFKAQRRIIRFEVGRRLFLACFTRFSSLKTVACQNVQVPAHLVRIQLNFIHFSGQRHLGNHGRHAQESSKHGARNFAHTSLMPSAFKRRFKKRINHSQRRFFRHKTRGNAQHVRIVVLSAQGSDFRSPCNGRTNTSVFVCRHGHAIGRSANQDAQRRFAVFDIRCHSVRVVGIIDAVLTIRSTVEDLVPLCTQMF